MLKDGVARELCAEHSFVRSQLLLVPNSSPESLQHIPVEHWWQASGSVPAQLGCLIQAGLSEYTAAGRHSAAPRQGQRQTNHRRLNATSNKQTFHDKKW